MMNKDEIQPWEENMMIAFGCGLVMNKDEIQHGRDLPFRPSVVVW